MTRSMETSSRVDAVGKTKGKSTLRTEYFDKSGSKGNDSQFERPVRVSGKVIGKAKSVEIDRSVKDRGERSRRIFAA